MGPKPTKLQLETLTKLAEPGVTLHWWSGLRGNDPSSASIVWPDPSKNKMGKHEKLRTDVLSKFHDWGWIEPVGDKAMSWRNNTYVITDAGREVVQKGEVRK